MEILLAIFLLMVALSLGGAMLVSGIVYKRLIKSGSKYPKTIRVIVFISGFAVIFITIYLVAAHNIRIER